MTTEELLIEQKAFEHVRSSRNELIKKFAPPEIYRSVENPISLFMAGSPGAGKTEISKNFVKKFQDLPVRIDADDIRLLCPGYIGSNAHLFQKAANKGVNILYDYSLDNNLNCILDGTFAYAGAAENIDRSLSRRRRVEIWFVFQDPVKAWEFTKARELRESRHISKEVFIEAFSESRSNARMVKERFGKQIELNLLVKDYEENKEELYLNVSADELDHMINSRYPGGDLESKLI